MKICTHKNVQQESFWKRDFYSDGNLKRKINRLKAKKNFVVNFQNSFPQGSNFHFHIGQFRGKIFS